MVSIVVVIEKQHLLQFAEAYCPDIKPCSDKVLIYMK